MKANNILLLIPNYEIVKDLKDESNITFLFPLDGFCVGYPKTFKLDEIKDAGFIFVNRILDNAGIQELKAILLNLPSNIKGIVFDDIGILNVLIDNNINITKILFLNHFNTNYYSINVFLNYVDSVLVSPDITQEETKEILKKANKPLVLYTFGYVNIMYSRRKLLTNYNDHFHKNVPKSSVLEEIISSKKFKIIENDYGTVIYPDKPYNGLRLKNEKNVLYHFINSVFLDNASIKEILNSDDFLENKYPYKYLSENATIYKLKGEEK